MAVVWLAGILGGFLALGNYEASAGKSRPAPVHWSLPAGAAFDGSRPNLILCAHPQCPCTRATVAELEKILTACNGRVATTVLFYAPTSEPTDWTRTALWQRAVAIPGVTVRADRDGNAAAALGAETSGAVLLFDRAGSLLFSGGITGARGHEGDNVGRRAVVDRILGRATEYVATPVFGCSLHADDDQRIPSP